MPDTLSRLFEMTEGMNVEIIFSEMPLNKLWVCIIEKFDYKGQKSEEWFKGNGPTKHEAFDNAINNGKITERTPKYHLNEQ